MLLEMFSNLETIGYFTLAGLRSRFRLQGKPGPSHKHELWKPRTATSISTFVLGFQIWFFEVASMTCAFDAMTSALDEMVKVSASMIFVVGEMIRTFIADIHDQLRILKTQNSNSKIQFFRLTPLGEEVDNENKLRRHQNWKRSVMWIHSWTVPGWPSWHWHSSLIFASKLTSLVLMLGIVIYALISIPKAKYLPTKVKNQSWKPKVKVPKRSIKAENLKRRLKLRWPS